MSNQVMQKNKAPLQHLAIIMDGNGRWAKKQGLPRVAGHHQGVQTVLNVVDECASLGIRYLSLFAFSSENWGRPQQEVDALMELLLQFLDSQRQKMLDNGIRLQVIGDRNRLSDSVCEALQRAEAETSGGTTLTLILALSYGGRDEILRAAKKMAEGALAGTIELDSFDNRKFSTLLDTGDIPEPDLLIRTSGEKRISNFLLWQAAYAEFYFTDVLWPDFDADELHKALEDYRPRKRRFGLIDDQLEPTSAQSPEGESH
ncbi:undecaprenyl diphosphate synthase [Malonomonas rubra DSM 5091]|uniref:Isoprenyl transferase n=1 Tax=Malonomonas rubra DSM 5091 TaxID=1122189 RepID=A0A1M6BQH1_MALRU|nr:isoprenyl transferase [Malonomonas rubra]SHI50972.1 undecaprenyl diphosphate synthase [Malonomonas rubra DSM 5091]